MAQKFVTDFGTFTVPNAYVNTVVQQTSASLPTSGVLMLVGEADSGPDYTLEADITQNFFGPDALSSIIAKYKSGGVVNAAKAAIAASQDPNIQGSVSAIFIAKTNKSQKASAALVRSGLTNYGTLSDLGFGELGNQTNGIVTASVSEVAPTTGAFTLGGGDFNLNLRVNGDVEQPYSSTGSQTIDTIVGSITSGSATGLNGLNGVLATGGQNRNVLQGLTGTASLALAVNTPTTITITLSGVSAWPNKPLVGDTLIIPVTGTFGSTQTSCISGAGDANAKSYYVTAVTDTTISATLSLADTPASLVVVNPTSIGTEATDIVCFNKVTIQNVTGVDRNILTGLVGKTVAGAASGSTLTLTLQDGSTWGALPQAGDLLLIPSTAPAAWHAGGANGGWYTVVSATSSTSAGGSKVVLIRLSNGSPASFSATAIAATTDLKNLSPVLDGVGKTLEIYDGAAVGSSLFSLHAQTSTSAYVGWMSTSSNPQVITSASEYVAQVVDSRASDSITDTITAGGDVVLLLGYHGDGNVTSATATVATVNGIPTLTTSVAGGSGASLSGATAVNLTKFTTLNDLATYLNSQTGYVCKVGSVKFGQSLLTYKDQTGATQTVLDKTTWNIASKMKAYAGRLKRDAWDFYNEMFTSRLVTLNSTSVTLGTPVATPAAAGLPQPQALFFLSGGTRGGTSNTDVTNALAALEKVKGNFLVPCFSRDATDDIADGLTDSTSTYTIDSINDLCKTHVVNLSQIKRARWRQGFLSKRTSFTNAKLAAQNIASPRCAMVFQDFKDTDVLGNLTQFQPYIGAAKAAGMQAAAFYKSIVRKFINTNGVLMNDGSFSDQLIGDVEDALDSGLLPAERADSGGYRWISDQTTYTIDDNFVYNSIQAQYASDLITAILKKRFEDAMIGQSLADMSAGVAMAKLKGIMADLRRLKLIVPSDDAPAGYKDAVIKIVGPAAFISVNVKLDNSIYFAGITTYVTQASQAVTG